MPITISTGKAIEIRPETKPPIRINGKNTKVNTTFVIPQAKRKAKKASLPKITNINIINKNSNI